MNKKLNLTIALENGKDMHFLISNIKEVEKEKAKELINALSVQSLFQKGNKKAIKVKKAEVISISKEEIEL